MAVIQSAERLLPAGLRGKAEPLLRALASDDPRNLAQRMALITFAIRVVSAAIAFVVENTIIFGTIGDENPLAATQFGFLSAATSLPITYMQAIDGQGYRIGGLSGGLLTDACLSLIACSVLLPVVLRWLGRDRKAQLGAKLPV